MRAIIKRTLLPPGCRVRLSVTTNSRAYLITLGYTSRDPDLAVLITNAFVAEILRSIKLQILSQQRSSTQASLSESLATFGDKFPRVIEAKLQLAAINSLLKKWHGERCEEILRSAGENVTQATALPSTRRRLVVALHLLIGVAISIGVALWLERARWWSALSRYGVETTERLNSITLSQAAKLLVAARLAKRQNALLAATAKDMRNPSKLSIGERQRHLPRPRRSSSSSVAFVMSPFRDAARNPAKSYSCDLNASQGQAIIALTRSRARAAHCNYPTTQTSVGLVPKRGEVGSSGHACFDFAPGRANGSAINNPVVSGWIRSF